MNRDSSGFPLSEKEILSLIDDYFADSSPDIVLGRGDDCAILRQNAQFCLSSDMFLEGAHFRRSYFLPEEIGHKALAVNLSDLAAMGARPVAFNLNLGLPVDINIGWLRDFFSGMAALATSASILLSGGDISLADSIHISITVVGQRADNCVLLRRGGIMPGDVLFLIGDIGLARIGLEEMEKKGRAAAERWPAACNAHLKPEPRLEAGLVLARAGYNARPPAVMDVSDGIAADLPRLLTPERGMSSLGAELFIAPDSLHAETLEHAGGDGDKAVEEAFRGGEDYALVGACAPDMFGPLHAAIPGLRRIGTVREGSRIFLNGAEVTGMAGFDHFAR